jgi:NAD(P)-dependent dehydrogenase (short-subunit alcohol dehydrogenase family)
LRKELTGKTVIVTGGGSGIGAAISRSFAEAGVAEVILIGRTKSKVDNIAQELSASFKGTKFTPRAADISSDDDVKKLFASLTTSPDILLNNAGYLASPANFLEVDMKDFWAGFTINVYGTALITQSYLRHREALKSSTTLPAVVITINTVGAYNLRAPNLVSYAASKAGLARWSELLAVDIPETTARFISLHPGAVKSDMLSKSELKGFPETDSKLTADFVVWSTSEEAKFLSGRFAHVNWDVDELIAGKEVILEKDLFRTALSE